MDEIWRPISSQPDYLASSHGRVMRIPHHAPMMNGGIRYYGGVPTRGVLTAGRYSFYYKGKNYSISRLICEAFAGPPPFPGAVCMHINEDAQDNRPENLAWGTQKENLNAPGFKNYCKSRVGGASPRTKWAARRKQEAA